MKVLIVIAALLYFCPAVVAFARGHRQKLAIALLNLLLGWTLIGWVAALVWAATRSDAPARTTVV